MVLGHAPSQSPLLLVPHIYPFIPTAIHRRQCQPCKGHFTHYSTPQECKPGNGRKQLSHIPHTTCLHNAWTKRRTEAGQKHCDIPTAAAVLGVGRLVQSPMPNTLAYFLCWRVSLSTSSHPASSASGLLLTASVGPMGGVTWSISYWNQNPRLVSFSETLILPNFEEEKKHKNESVSQVLSHL